MREIGLKNFKDEIGDIDDPRDVGSFVAKKITKFIGYERDFQDLRDRPQKLKAFFETSCGLTGKYPQGHNAASLKRADAGIFESWHNEISRGRMAPVFIIATWYSFHLRENKSYANELDFEILHKRLFDDDFQTEKGAELHTVDGILSSGPDVHLGLEKEAGSSSEGYSSGKTSSEADTSSLTHGIADSDGFAEDGAGDDSVEGMALGIRPKSSTNIAVGAAILLAIAAIGFGYFFSSGRWDTSSDGKAALSEAQAHTELKGDEGGAAAFQNAMEQLRAGNEERYRDALVEANELEHPTAPGDLAIVYETAVGADHNSRLAEGFGKVALKRHLRALAESGDRDAQYTYGLMLIHGVAVPKDPDEGIRYLEMAFDGGLSRAALKLSFYSIERDGVGAGCSGFDHAVVARQAGYLAAYWIEAQYLQNFACPAKMGSKVSAQADALGLLRDAAKRGHADSQNLLGVFYKEGFGVPANADSDSEAVKWFRAAADQGLLDAIDNLGVMYALGRGVTASNENDAIAVELFKKAADLGEARGQYSLGWMYAHGRVASSGADNDAQAVFWFKKAADQEYIKAQSMLGWMFKQNRGVPDDPNNDTTAVNLFKLAADQQLADAQYELGWMYAQNRGLPKSDGNDVEAVKWFRAAAEQGFARAQESLGRMYFWNRGVPEDEDHDALALDWFLTAAKKENSDGQVGVGVIYAKGRGVKQDYATAVHWYRLAAAQDNARAMFNLGVMYEYGRGVPQDYKAAFDWYEKSALKGDVWAKFNLGSLYEHGRGVAPSYRDAVRWYQEAAAAGDVDAQVSLGWMYESGRGVPLSSENDAKAVEWYIKAAEMGNARAQTNLGAMYEHGRGIKQDYAAAVHWYKEGAQQNYARAQYNLAWMYAEGLGVVDDGNNEAQAIQLYEDAAENGYGWARLELAKLYTLAAKPKLDMAKRQLDKLINGKEVDVLRSFFPDGDWDIVLVDSIPDTRVACEIHRLRCFGYADEQLIQKVQEIAKTGVPFARAALVAYQFGSSECDKAKTNLERLKFAAEGNDTDAGIAYALAGSLANEYDCGGGAPPKELLSYVYSSAADGSRDAIFNLTIFPWDKENIAAEAKPDWLEELESNSERLSDPDLWSAIGDLYRNGEAGIIKQPTKAEFWYMRALELGESKISERLAELYINDFSPSRVGDAVQLVIANSDPQKARDFLSQHIYAEAKTADEIASNEAIASAIQGLDSIKK